jgi:hypothetical protein
MLRTLKRLHLWWTRHGEGAWFSRFVAIVSLVLFLAGMALSSAILTYVFGGIAALVAVRELLLLEFWPWRKRHPGSLMPSQIRTHLPPEPGRDSPYRFCLVDSVHDLRPYIDEGEYFFGESNPELDSDGRRELYETWFRLCPWAFLYLTKTDQRSPVALSIILPLKKNAYDRLYGKGQPQRKIIEFGQEEICRRGPYEYLLYDTFIITSRKERTRTRSAPKRQRGYGQALVHRHLAHFWKDKAGARSSPKRFLGLPDPRPVVVVAETNKRKLIEELLEVGFVERGKSAIGLPLYEFRYPCSTGNKAQEELVQALVARIWEVRKWSVRLNKSLER